MSGLVDPTAGERLLALLPSIFRTRDHEEAVHIAAVQGFPAPDPLSDQAHGPLLTLLEVLGQQFDLLEAEVDWLYEDQFIETCADWVIPYIGALVGARIINVGDARSARLQVADTIANRRAKGTARALANRAHDVMVAPAEAIEYAAFVVQAYNPNFPGDGRAQTVAINGLPGRALGLPTTLVQHVAEVRDMREGGRFAARNIGARVWTAHAVRHQKTVPSEVTGGQPGRFRFHPLGHDIALWSPPVDFVPDRSRLMPDEIPGPIPLIAAVDDAGAYYGPDRMEIEIAGVVQPLAQICFCDLADDGGPGQWNHRGSPAELGMIRIDPARGRFLLPGGGAEVDPATIRILYYFGSSLRTASDPLSAGGAWRVVGSDIVKWDKADRAALGDRDRRSDTLITFAAPATISDSATPAQVDSLLKTALDALAANPAVRLEFGGRVGAPNATVVPASIDAELRGGDGVWPTVMLTVPWEVQQGAGSVLTLRGLRLAGGDLIVRAGGLRQLTLIDCTVLPGSGRIIIEEPTCKLLAVRSVLGAVRVAVSVEIDLIDSLIDSGAADTAAIAAADGSAAGILWAERTTILGDCVLLAIDEVSDTIFAARPDRSLATPAVSVKRLQSGCVRYSAVPRGSLVPRRYRCFPGEDDPTSPAPVFASLDYDQAAYGALVAANPDPLLAGAENGGEMGIGNSDRYHRRKQLLDDDLVEWVPFGMAVATQFMSD